MDKHPLFTPTFAQHTFFDALSVVSLRNKVSCCLIIPLFNHSATIRDFHSALLSFLKDSLRESIIPSVLYVDDGSNDDTFSIAKSLMGSKDIEVHAIRLETNCGQARALFEGLKRCETSVAILRSADLQEPFEVTRSAIENHLKYGNSVICVRENRHDGLINRLLSNIFYTVIKVLYPPMPFGGFDHVLLTRPVIDKLKSQSESVDFLQLAILKTSGPFCFESYNREKDRSRRSQWTLGKKIKYAHSALRQVIFTGVLKR